jgi:regulator of sigma E protease
VLPPGDELVAVDGREGDFLALRDQISTHECAGEQEDGCTAATPATLTILRDGQEITRTIRPEYDAELGRPLLGFVPGAEPLNLSAPAAAERSADFMWEITTSTVGVIARIFDAEQREQISSVVGSYEVTRQAIEFDAERALTLLAVISLSLAIINMFPFLPLDGGHIFWSIVEKVRGAPVPFRVMERASVVGFVLVLMLFAVGLSNDIDRLTGEGFDVR